MGTLIDRVAAPLRRLSSAVPGRSGPELGSCTLGLRTLIVRDVASARSLREVLGYTWGRPGWSPDGSRKTSATLKAEWRKRELARTKERP